MKRMNSLSVSFSSLVAVFAMSLTLGCAKELSKEQLERENRDRVLERVSGSKGEFNGFILQGSRLVPMELSVEVRTASGGAASATPIVTMKTGLFGGVTVSAQDASYDAGRNELTARFLKGTKVTLELKGIMNDKGFEGSLVGDTSRSQRVQLKRRTASTAALSEKLLSYRTNFKNLNGKDFPQLPSVMTLRLDLNSVKSPDSFDLDQMLLMSMAFRFDGLARVATNATTVAYDPLISKMEVKLSDRLSVRFEGLAFEEGQVPADSIPDKLNGTLFQDSRKVGTVVGVRIEDAVNVQETSAPQPTYSGCMHMPASGLVYPVIARLKDLNTDILNPAQILFPKGPAFSLEVTILTADGENFGRMFLGLSEIDSLNSKLLFRQQKGSSFVDLDISIGQKKPDPLAWNTLSGSLQTPRQPFFVAARSPRLVLSAGEQAPNCKPVSR